MKQYCCYADNENIICEDDYCDECSLCPDAYWNDDDDDDDEGDDISVCMAESRGGNWW